MFVFSNDTYWPQIITNNENDRKYVYKKDLHGVTGNWE